MASHIERRKFLATLGSAAAARPLTARGQQTRGRPLIGILSPQPARAAAPNFEALRQALHELGRPSAAIVCTMRAAEVAAVTPRNATACCQQIESLR